MKYYKNGGFYDKEIHGLALAGGDAEQLEECWAAFIADAVEITDEYWKELMNGQAQGKRIEPDENGYPVAVAPPEKTLDELKAQAVNRLWRNYKAHQQKYVDAEDLTLATLCAAKGSEKGSVVQMWVMSLWAQYYTVRDAISGAETEEALSAIDLTAEWYGEPPYTIRELNEEAAAFLANTSGGESTTTTTEENKE